MALSWFNRSTSDSPHHLQALPPDPTLPADNPGGLDSSSLELLTAALDAAPVNIMVCDEHLILRYLNRNSRDTLKRLQTHLSMPVEQLIGQSIHIFHKQPKRSEEILGSTPQHGFSGHHKLPHSSVIELGSEKLDLSIAPILGSGGHFLGAVVSWSQVTSKLEAALRQQETLSDGVRDLNAQLQMLSSATHQIDASVGEIAQSAAQVANSAQRSTAASDEGIQAIDALKLSSDGVAKVSNLIASIATQTSVLALNATIESARAGVHGKGFSVVAGEVKKLAEQTASATADIQSKVTSIRGNIEAAVQAIQKVSAQAGDVNGLSHMLASAAEEQKLAVREMAESLQRAAHQTEQIASVRLH